MSLSPDELERYTRHLSLDEVGPEGQEKLKRARVTIVGLGGLGCPVALYLTAAGIGQLTLVDHDSVSLSNLQRQILHSTPGIGSLKTLSARAGLTRLNPHTAVTGIATRLTQDNAVDLLKDSTVIVDAGDNFATRLTIAHAAETLHIPVVYGAVKRFAGQVSVFAPHLGTTSFRDLFPDGATPSSVSDEASAFGIIGAHAGIIGSIQALETLKLILGIPSPLVGGMLSVDTLRMRFHIIRLAHGL